MIRSAHDKVNALKQWKIQHSAAEQGGAVVSGKGNRLNILQRKTETATRSGHAPVAVTVAGIGIISICVLSVFLLMGDLGLNSLGGWIGSSAEAWDSTLVLLAALLLICVEVRCGVAILYGQNWGRWGYVACQALVTLYMLMASFWGFLPDIFHISGETRWEIFHQLLMQKLPEAMVIVLLFAPRRSRRFFQRRPLS